MLTALLPVLIFTAIPIVDAVNADSAARNLDLTRYDAGLTASDPAIVVATVHAIGRLQTETALPRLTAALGHADWRVRQAAAFAWGQIEAAPAAPLKARITADAAPDVRVTSTQALGKLKDVDWGFLREAGTADADHRVRVEARIALGLQARRNDGVGHGLTMALPGWLKDGDPTLRRAAAYAFRRATKLDGPTHLEAALECASDSDGEVRALCVRVLGRFGDLEPHQAQALDAQLIKAVGDADWRVGVEAWRSAGEAKRLAAVAPTLMVISQQYRALETPRLHVWTAGLDALLDARLPDARPVAEHLFRLQSDGDSSPGIALGLAHVRCRAAAILDLSGGDRLATCDAAAPKGLIAALTGPVLAGLPPPKRAEAIVTRYAAAKTPGMRIALLEAAGELKDQPSMTAVVVQGVGDPDVAVFSQAAASAGKLGIAKSGEAILLRLTDLLAAREYEAAIAAIDALAGLKHAPAQATLNALLADSNVSIAEHASAALKALGITAAAAPTPPKPTLRGAPDAKAAVVQTTKGKFTIDLHAADAPITVQNFVTLAEKGFYDGLLFHRVVGDFVVQGGDPRGDGWGGPGYAIPCEINPQRYHRGAVGMALAGKDTGGSQWFVTHAPQPHLDGRYTVFGQVKTFEVVDALAVGDRILKVTIER